MLDLRARFEASALPLVPAVYAAARRLTRGSEHARDLVQETYLHAYRTFASAAPGTNVRAWLLAILHAVFTARVRSPLPVRPPAAGPVPSAEPVSSAASGAGSGEPEPLTDPNIRVDEVERCLERWSSLEIDGALLTLPDVFREAVLLVDVEELSYEEAAHVVGVTVGVLRSRLFRGRALLYSAMLDLTRRAAVMPPSLQVPHE